MLLGSDTTTRLMRQLSLHVTKLECRCFSVGEFFPCVSLFLLFFNFCCCVCHGMFMTQCSESNDVQPGHSFLFKMAFWSKPTHFKGKQSFKLVNGSSVSGLSVLTAKRESLSKVQHGARMPGQRRAGHQVHVLSIMPKTIENRKRDGA